MNNPGNANVPPRIPVIRTRPAEIKSIMAFLAFIQEIEIAESDMQKRLKAIPNGWRDIRMIKAVLNKLLVKLMITVPEEKRATIKRNAKHTSYQVSFNRSAFPRDDTMATTILIDDMDALCQVAHRYQCIGCEGRCSECDLGKALDHCCAVSRGKNERWADFTFTKEGFNRV